MWKQFNCTNTFNFFSFCQIITFLYAFGRNNFVLKCGCFNLHVQCINYTLCNYKLLYIVQSLYSQYIQNKFVCMTCLHLWYNITTVVKWFDQIYNDLKIMYLSRAWKFSFNDLVGRQILHDPFPIGKTGKKACCPEGKFTCLRWPDSTFFKPYLGSDFF